MFKTASKYYVYSEYDLKRLQNTMIEKCKEADLDHLISSKEICENLQKQYKEASQAWIEDEIIDKFGFGFSDIKEKNMHNGMPISKYNFPSTPIIEEDLFEKNLNETLKRLNATNEPMRLLTKLQIIAKERGTEYAVNTAHDIMEKKATGIALDVVKMINPIKPFNVIIRGIEKISNVYDKIDKTKEFNFGADVYNDIKNINLAEHKPEEKGYEFVKYIQDFELIPTEAEMKAFDHKVQIAADMVQEGY